MDQLLEKEFAPLGANSSFKSRSLLFWKAYIKDSESGYVISSFAFLFDKSRSLTDKMPPSPPSPHPWQDQIHLP